jgi:DNA-binding CsgD family transcriptional regulator
MDDIADIIMRRSAPGILIFDRAGVRLFSNSEALELVAAYPSLEDEARALCSRVNTFSNPSAISGDGAVPQYVLRAFVVGEAEGRPQKHIIVLIEKVVGKRTIDLEGAKKKFNVSKRELEVLALIHEGLTNKAISDRLFISEQTVKDHIRHIMGKVGVNSRGALIAATQ